MAGAYTFTRCIELTKPEIIEASRSREQCAALLEHFAWISKPDDGAPLMLLLFARLATVACDWLDGDLRIELDARPPSDTSMNVMTELGGGFREKVFSEMTLHVPLDEFARAIRRVPQMVQPLVVKISAEQVLLTATEQVRLSTVAPPIIFEESLITVPRAPAVPRIDMGASSEPRVPSRRKDPRSDEDE